MSTAGGVAVESSFTWLDHRAEDAERAREVLKALDEGGTVDSLGIGTIRDALADILFPAVSTLHTRARYLLLVPWVYRSIEADRVPSRRAAKVGRERELQLTDALLAGSEDHQGIIGRNARRTLKQLPRVVYWNGTRVLGIRRFSGSIPQYFQSLDGYYRRGGRRQLATGDDPDAGGPVEQNWDPSMPEPPDGWLEATTLALTLEEAEYLRDRAQATIPETYLGALFRAGEAIADDSWPWTHSGGWSETIQRELTHAQWFSETIHGAQILYNVLVARRIVAESGAGRDQAEALVDRFEGWAERADANQDLRSRQWDREDFWRTVYEQNPRIPGGARAFVEGWCDRVDEGTAGLLDDGFWHRQIEARELKLKKGLARLSSSRARETWNGSSGITQLSFRWPEVRAVVTDVADGLSRDG